MACELDNARLTVADTIASLIFFSFKRRIYASYSYVANLGIEPSLQNRFGFLLSFRI